MQENNFSFSAISLKSTIVHTVSYFIVGFLSFTFFDYSAKFADPIAANMFRQTDHPLVAAGPLFQVLRGFLFGIVFYFLQKIIFTPKHGWLTLWLVLIIVGIISPFGAAPSSIEGMLYTVLPTWFHVMGLPEVFMQAGLLAFITYFGVAPNYLVTLEVAGRRSGRRIRLPLVMAVVAGERYLVSMLGAGAGWVQNARAAGG